MPTYAIDLAVPSSNIEEFIEALREIGGADSIQFVIEADSRRVAVKETTAMLNEFSATYRGTYLDVLSRESISDNLRRTPARTVNIV